VCFGNHHAIGNGVTVHAQERDVQRLVVAPVVALQPHATSTPGAATGPFDQPELLSERRGVTRGASSNPSWTQDVATDLQVASKTGELGVLAIPSAFFHDPLPVLKP